MPCRREGDWSCTRCFTMTIRRAAGDCYLFHYHLLWTEGRQYSGKELTEMLSEAGFKAVEVKRSFGLWSIVTGVK